MEDNVVEVIEKSTQTTILERNFEKGRIELSQVGLFEVLTVCSAIFGRSI